MKKNNYNALVGFAKFWNFVVEHKILVWALIIFMLTFRFECGNKKGKFRFSFSCEPLRVQDVRGVLGENSGL